MASLSHVDHLDHAWHIQFTGISERILDVDIAKECLNALEEEMFEIPLEQGLQAIFSMD